MMWYDMMSWTFCPQPPQNQYSINPNNCFIMLSWFPNSVSLGSSAIYSKGSGAGRSSQIRLAQGWEPGSGKGLLFQENPSEQPNPHGRGWEPGSQEEVPKQGSQEEVPKQGFQARFPRGAQEQVPKQGFPARGSQSQEQVPKQGSQAMFPGRGSQQGSQARFPGKVTRNRFPSKGSQQEVPRKRLPRGRFSGRVFQEQVPKQGS